MQRALAYLSCLVGSSPCKRHSTEPRFDLCTKFCVNETETRGRLFEASEK